MADIMEVDSDVLLPSGSNETAPPPVASSSKTPTPLLATSSVLAGPATIPSVTVSLHPLVIMNMSEHWTRIRAQEGSKQQGTHLLAFYAWSLCIHSMFFRTYIVIGALIGKQKGRNIEVMNSFELKFEFVEKDIIINQEYYTTKEEQCMVWYVHLRVITMYIYRFADKQVFSDLDFLGWYTTGDGPTEQDIKVHKQICIINECPILLQMNPQTRNVEVCWNMRIVLHM